MNYTPSNISQTLTITQKLLKKYRIPQPRLEAELLLAHCLKTDRTGLYRNPSRCLTPTKSAALKKLCQKRTRNIPMAYLTGRQEFMGLSFKVNRSVLIPRPETEILVETTLSLITPQKPYLIMEIGTGSGNIAVSLAKLSRNKKIKIFASDISTRALTIALQNARQHQVSDRIKLFRGDLFAAFKKLNIAGQIDLIVSNPPYVSEKEYQQLPADVKNYEPRLALTTGKQGMAIHQRIIKGAGRYLKPGGHLIMEMGIDQVGHLKKLLEKANYFDKIIVLPDYRKISRVIVGRFTRKS